MIKALENDSYDPKKVILYPKNKLAKTIRTGDQVSITGKSGQIRSYKVIQLHDDMVSLDGNHQDNSQIKIIN